MPTSKRNLVPFVILLSLTIPAFGAHAKRPTISFTASPTSITAGASSKLTWSTTNATTCAASGGWTGTEPISGSLSVSPVTSTTYVLSCTGAGGTTQDALTVTVKAAPKPTVTLTASPTSIQSGAASKLTWSSANATTCTATGGWSGTKATSGTASVSPTATTSYSLACSGAGGSAAATATVTVTTPPAPTVTLTASPTSIQSGSASKLTWSSTNATTCTATGGWSGTEATSGTASISPTTTTSYTLACSGAGGSAQATTTVTVTAPPPAPTVTLTATPASVQSGVASTLAWSSTNATSCTASGGWSGSEPTSGSTSESPTATTSYSLVCTGAGGSGSATATITVTATPQPTVTLTASPATISSGTGSTLSWSSTNASSCTASGGWSGTQPTSGTASVSPTATTSYTLNCTGTGGSAQATATVTVSSGTTITYWLYYNGQYTWPGDWSFAATPNYQSTTGSPLSGPYDIQVTTTTWGGWQPYAANSSFDLSPYTTITLALQPTQANQQWSLAFTKAGATSASTTVNVLNYGPTPVVGQWGVYNIPLSALGVSGAAVGSFVLQDQSGLANNVWYIDNVGFVPASGVTYPPTLTMTASPILFTAPGTTTISWSSTNASSCTATGAWTGAESTSGTKTVSVTATNAFNLTCTGPGGSASATSGVTLTNPNAFSIQVSGNTFVNGAGKTVQLRGVNLSGMEFTAVGGWDPSDPTGGNFGQPNNPNWTAIGTNWKANIVRIPLNEDSWLGLTCTDTDGVVRNADPGANYKQALANLVQEANSAGIYVILDLHWAAPGSSCPFLQSQMADTDHSLAFWTSIANTYKNNPAVMFELFNEPFLDFDFTGDAWQYLMFGTGGSFSGYPASSLNGTWANITTPWNIASYQAMINAVRATGATNPVLIGSVGYTSDLSGWLSHKPTDPIGQMAATWHPYPTYGATWGTPAWAQPNNSPEIFTEVQSILAAGIPVIATETGDQDSAGTVGAPLVNTITTFADANGVSVLGWTWDVWQGADFILIQDVNGTPTDGYGQFFQAWMVNHP